MMRNKCRNIFDCRSNFNKDAEALDTESATRIRWQVSAENPNSPHAQGKLLVLFPCTNQVDFSTGYIAVLHSRQSQMRPVTRRAHLIRRVELLERGPDCANICIHLRIREKFCGPAHRLSPPSLSNHKQPYFLGKSRKAKSLILSPPLETSNPSIKKSKLSENPGCDDGIT